MSPRRGPEINWNLSPLTFSLSGCSNEEKGILLSGCRDSCRKNRSGQSQLNLSKHWRKGRFSNFPATSPYKQASWSFDRLLWDIGFLNPQRGNQFLRDRNFAFEASFGASFRDVQFIPWPFDRFIWETGFSSSQCANQFGGTWFNTTNLPGRKLLLLIACLSIFSKSGRALDRVWEKNSFYSITARHLNTSIILFHTLIETLNFPRSRIAPQRRAAKPGLTEYLLRNEYSPFTARFWPPQMLVDSLKATISQGLCRPLLSKFGRSFVDHLRDDSNWKILSGSPSRAIPIIIFSRFSWWALHWFISFAPSLFVFSGIDRFPEKEWDYLSCNALRYNDNLD
jgi:hypothetical protein